jgi:hypothetical protein
MPEHPAPLPLPRPPEEVGAEQEAEFLRQRTLSAAAELDVVGLGNTNGIGNYCDRNLGYNTIRDLGGIRLGT